MHDGLKYGGKGRYSDTGAYKNRVLSSVDIAGGASKWSIYVNLQKFKFLKNILIIFG